MRERLHGKDRPVNIKKHEELEDRDLPALVLVGLAKQLVERLDVLRFQARAALRAGVAFP